MDLRDRRIGLLARQLAQCASVHNVATLLLQDAGAWDCSMVFFEAIDVVGHHFMQYYPPRMEHVSEADFARFQRVIPGVYELQDAMLARLVELAGPETTVVVLSDHGFHSDHLRPRVQAAVDDPHAAMDATWHRPHGMLVMSGPGIVAGAEVYGAGLLDIAPTVLTLLGVPVGADMDGRVLREGMQGEVEVERVFSWDDLPGEAGVHPAGMQVDPIESREAMRQLEELGYMSPMPEGEREQAAAYGRETKFNLGVVYLTTGRMKEATGVFEELHRSWPDDPRFATNLAQCRLTAGRLAEAAEILGELVRKFPQSPDAHLLRGAALMAQGKAQEAAAALEVAVSLTPDRPDLLCAMAGAYVQLKRWEEAERFLVRAESLDPQDPMVHYRRSQLELERHRFEEAAEHALTAVQLRHFFPEGHYALGVALTWMKDYEHAIASFKVALSMQAGMLDAHRYIASIYRLLGDRPKARPHREAAERLLAARAAGGPAMVQPMEDPPMGPQAWARELGLGESE
jgi:tetratricopeptide (TPR) repeat protein